MGRLHETVSTVNTTLRTLLMLVLVGAAGFFGYKGYEIYNEPRQQLADKQAELDKALETIQTANRDLESRNKEIDSLNLSLAEKAAQIDRLEVTMQLLKVTRRLARLTVLEQRKLPQPVASTPEAQAKSKPDLVTRIEFVEVNENGQPIGEPKQFDIVGDMVYVDYLRVTFDDKYIEQSDLDRSTAIALFQRIFGEYQEPVQGFQLDTVGTRPTAYARGADVSAFERRIWDDFWLIANDKQRAEELGIHGIHGSAVSIRARPGMIYEIELRSTGDMTIGPVQPVAPITPVTSN